MRDELTEAIRLLTREVRWLRDRLLEDAGERRSAQEDQAILDRLLWEQRLIARRLRALDAETPSL